MTASFEILDKTMVRSRSGQLPLRQLPKFMAPRVREPALLRQPYRSVATGYLWRELDPMAVEY